VISFKEGASFLLGLENDWQDKVTQGKGETYGAEFFIQKKKGRTTGWIGYTLSWNWRQFDVRYDRRHDISVVVSHDFTKKISGSLAWVYGTGNAVTLEIFQYNTVVRSNGESGLPDYHNGYTVGTNGDKNGFRMSDYHRLDASIDFKKKKRWGEAAWVLSVYNAYWNRNPYFILADEDYDFNTGKTTTKFKEISILPIKPLPTVYSNSGSKLSK